MVCYRAMSSADNDLNVSASVLVCTHNLHELTTRINDMHLDIFLENISSCI